jgi:BRO1-like domain
VSTLLCQLYFPSSSGGLPPPPSFSAPKPAFKSEQCRSELVRLQSLRNDISFILTKPNCHQAALTSGSGSDEYGMVSIITEPQPRILLDLYEYHAVLLEFEKRGFPAATSSDGTGLASDIPWKNAFQPSVSEKHGSLVWERSCILYNIVAIQTALVASVMSATMNKTSGSDPGGGREMIKQAISLNQTAASLAVVLRELVSASSDSYSTIDLSTTLLVFWEKVLLAQAQYCIYQLAASSPQQEPNHSLLSQIAQGCYTLFNEALQAAQDPRIVSDLPTPSRKYGTYCKLHSMLSAIHAEYHQAVLHQKNGGYRAVGMEIYRLRTCREKLQTCIDYSQEIINTKKDGDTTDDNVGSLLKSMNRMEDVVYRECKSLLPVVSDRQAVVEYDNYHIYHDEIPTELPNVESKVLAKLNLINNALPSNMMVPAVPLFTKL